MVPIEGSFSYLTNTDISVKVPTRIRAGVGAAVLELGLVNGLIPNVAHISFGNDDNALSRTAVAPGVIPPVGSDDNNQDTRLPSTGLSNHFLNNTLYLMFSSIALLVSRRQINRIEWIMHVLDSVLIPLTT